MHNKLENVFFIQTKGVRNLISYMDNAEHSFFTSGQKFNMILLLKALFRAVAGEVNE